MKRSKIRLLGLLVLAVGVMAAGDMVLAQQGGAKPPLKPIPPACSEDVYLDCMAKEPDQCPSNGNNPAATMKCVQNQQEACGRKHTC